MDKKELTTLLASLGEIGKEGEVEVDGGEVRVTSPDRPLWPKSELGEAVLKRDLLEYFATMSWVMLPHLRSRPLTLVRMPAGLDGGRRFYQRHWESARPDYVETVSIYTFDQKGPETYLMANNLPTLLWMGQNATLEVHSWYSRVDPEGWPEDFASSEEAVDASALNYPDVMVFDLDPSVQGGKKLTPAAFQRVRDTASALAEELDKLGLKAWFKTSGKSGIHVSVPLKRVYTYDQVRGYAEKIGEKLVAAHPDLITLERLIADRGENVYFDYHQNGRGKSLVAVYSPRAVEGAMVSFPFAFKDLASIYPTDFTIRSAPKLIAQGGDAWRDLFENRQELDV